MMTRHIQHNDTSYLQLTTKLYGEEHDDVKFSFVSSNILISISRRAIPKENGSTCTCSPLGAEHYGDRNSILPDKILNRGHVYPCFTPEIDDNFEIRVGYHTQAQMYPSTTLSYPSWTYGF